MFKKMQLIWADKIALSLALFIVAAAGLCWIMGMVGLDGHPNLRFDNAMLDWTTQLELILVPAVWLLLRVLDFAARAVFQILRAGLAHIGSPVSSLPLGAGMPTGGSSV